jgi:hypothetical protein
MTGVPDMIDIDLLVEALRKHGHSVETVFPVPENAGDYELSVDGRIMPMAEARLVLEQDEAG